MITRIPGKAFLFVTLALCVPAAWLLGNGQAEDQTRAQLEQVKADALQEQARLQQTIGSLQSDIEQQALSLEIVEARAAALQDELDSGVRQSIDDVAELALYRRIEGTESERGIWVDAINRISSQPDTLSITLIQSRGRERAVGAIGVTLYSEAGGQGRRWVLSDNGAGQLTPVALPEGAVEQQGQELLGSSLIDDVVKAVPFDLRFFQTLLVKVENITTIKPEYVEIWILPNGKRLKPELQRFRWAEISLIDDE